MRITVDLGPIASGARLHELIAPHRDDVRCIEMTERDARALSYCLGVQIKYGTPDAALFGHPVVWVDEPENAEAPRPAEAERGAGPGGRLDDHG